MQDKNTFDNWNLVKQEVENRTRETNFFIRPGNIVWINLGRNVGDEEHGKGEKSERPILVLKVFNQNLFWGLAMTSKIKEGNKYYFKIKIEYKENLNYTNPAEVSVILSQLKIFDTKRITEKIGKIDSEDFAELKQKIRNLI